MASSAVISGPSNTAYAGPIDLETFLDMYERLRERVLYFTVDNLIDRPISFTKNEFDFDSDEYPFGIKRLLKSAKSHKVIKPFLRSSSLCLPVLIVGDLTTGL